MRLSLRERASERERCPFCYDRIGGPTLGCAACGVQLHPECWQEVALCPVAGCGGRPHQPGGPPASSGARGLAPRPLEGRDPSDGRERGEDGVPLSGAARRRGQRARAGSALEALSQFGQGLLDRRWPVAVVGLVVAWGVAQREITAPPARGSRRADPVGYGDPPGYRKRLALALKDPAQSPTARRSLLDEIARDPQARPSWYVVAALADLVAPRLDPNLGHDALRLLERQGPHLARTAGTLRLLLDEEGRLDAAGLAFDLETWPAWAVADYLGFCLREGEAELRSRAAGLAERWLAAGPRGEEAAQSLVPAALQVLASDDLGARRSAVSLLANFEVEPAQFAPDEVLGLLAREEDPVVAEALIRWVAQGGEAEVLLLVSLAEDGESVELSRVLAVEALGRRLGTSRLASEALGRLVDSESPPAVRAAAQAGLAGQLR